MMFKQSPSRNLRAHGRRYKVKYVSQICLTLVVSLWMLYQLGHCYFNKASINERTGLVRIGRREDKAGSRKVAATLGRKGLLPGLVDDEDAKITYEEAGRWDEFEQVDDLLEETDEQEADTDDTEQENQSDDDLTENLTKRNSTYIVRD